MTAALHRFALALLTGAALAHANAQPASAPAQAAPPIPFGSVADALKTLESRDGNGTIVVHSDGWTIANEPLASTQWSFTPAGYYAYPALVRRIIKRNGNEVTVDVSLLCEAGKEACAKLQTEFEGMNDRISQAVRARGRQTPGTAPK